MTTANGRKLRDLPTSEVLDALEDALLAGGFEDEPVEHVARIRYGDGRPIVAEYALGRAILDLVEELRQMRENR